MMRIVFIGAVEFSRVCLEEVLAQGGQVVLIITLFTELARRHADYADLQPVAARHNIPVLFVKDINAPDVVAHLKELQPDIFFVFGWSQLISPELLALPPRGVLGTHPALLPEHRGRHPLIWALVEGLERSGLTFFYIDEGIDSGDILAQKPFEITIDDDARSLYGKMTRLACEIIREQLPLLENNQALRQPQDHQRATYWRKRTFQDGEIHWANDSLTIYNLVRALTRPYVGAHTWLRGELLKIWKTHLVFPQPVAWASAQPGEVLPGNSAALWVRTGDGVLELVEWEGPVPHRGDRLGEPK